MVNLNNLFLIIEKNGLTASKVAADTGISTGNISDWKNGRSMPSAMKLDVLADYLNCSIDYLLGRTDNPEIHIKDSAIQIHDITNSGTQAIGNNIKLENIKDSEQLKSDITGQEYELIKMLREMPFEDSFKCLQFIVTMYKKGE